MVEIFCMNLNNDVVNDSYNHGICDNVVQS